MATTYPVKVNLNCVGKYVSDGELQSKLYHLFDAFNKPYQKCWGFTGKNGSLYAEAVLFENHAQAQQFAEMMNEQFLIVMNQPFEVSVR